MDLTASLQDSGSDLHIRIRAAYGGAITLLKVIVGSNRIPQSERLFFGSALSDVMWQ
jgi:hypothetical protein